SDRSLLRRWEQCGQPKIVVSCKNQQEMNKLKESAESIGLPTFVVADAGRTQVSAGSKTVLAVGPGQLCVALFLTWAKSNSGFGDRKVGSAMTAFKKQAII
ncbi:peptidyl-tRNA hydrolase mitochondrial-like, partial [Trifolium pratense]